MCSSNASDPANRLRKTRKKKSSVVPLFRSGHMPAICARPSKGKGEKIRGWKTAGFLPSCESPLSLGRSGADCRHVTAVKKGTAVGLPKRVFLRLFAVHRQRTATQVGYFQQAQHTRVAQFVSLEVADSTYGLGVRCNLASQVPCVTTCQGFARHCYTPEYLLLPFWQFALCRALR